MVLLGQTSVLLQNLKVPVAVSFCPKLLFVPHVSIWFYILDYGLHKPWENREHRGPWLQQTRAGGSRAFHSRCPVRHKVLSEEKVMSQLGQLVTHKSLIVCALV